MYRKLVISTVSVLGLMTLCVSAQQPVQIGSSSGGQSNSPNQMLAPGTTQGNFLWSYGPGGNGQQRREEFELTRKTEDLVKQLSKAEGEKREKVRGQLTETLGKQFDHRQKRHEAEILALEAQVKKLKDLVQKRQDNRREIISKRLEQLVRDAEGLGW